MVESATRTVDVVAGFVDLTPQGLPFLRGEPALAPTFGLSAVCAIAVLALLHPHIGLGRLLLCLAGTRLAIRVALLGLHVDCAS